MGKRSWSKENLIKLKYLIEVEKKDYEELSKIFNKSQGSIQTLVSKLGLNYTGKKAHEKWEEKEIDELRRYLNEEKSYDELESLFKGRHPIHSIKGIIKHRGKTLNLVYSGNKRQQYTEELIQECIELYNLGFTVSEIAKKKNLKSKDTLPKILRKRGIVKSNSEKFEKGFVRGKGDSIKLTKKFLKKEIIDNKKSFKQLSSELGIDPSTVARHCSRFGIKKPTEEKIRKPDSNKVYLLKKYLNKKKLTKEDKKKKVHEIIPKELIVRLISKKLKNQEIAKQLEISLATLQKCYKLHNITVKGPSLSDYSDEFFKDLYVNKGLGYGDISDITGLAIDTLRKHLKKLFPEHNKQFGKFSSFGEKLVGDALNNLGIENTYSYPTEFGSVYKNHKVIIDFRIVREGKEYWIEYNGEQHYVFFDGKTNMFTKGDPKIYLNQVNRDNSIRKYCKENSIILIEIPFNYRSLKNIENILKSIILEGKSPEEYIDLSIYFNKIDESLSLINQKRKRL